MALRELAILGLTVAACSSAFGCFRTGRMPSATLPPDVEPSQPRMLERNPPSQGSPLQALRPGAGTPIDLPGLAVEPWKPSVPSRHWTSIVMHHTASSQGSVESIHATHLQRRDRNGNPWMGIGYHFVIGNGRGMGDGEIEPTFRWRQQLQGAHAGDDEHNQLGIGIALIGNFEEAPPSPAQLAAARRLVTVLRARYGIDARSVLRHGDIKPTACPGKYFPIAEITLRRKEPLAGEATPAKDVLRVASEERNRR